MLYVALKPINGVISGFIKPGKIVNIGDESPQFHGVVVNVGHEKNMFVHPMRIHNGDLTPVHKAFRVCRVYNLAGDDVYDLSAMSELEALDIVLETETGETIKSKGGFFEGEYSYGAGDYAVLKRK